MRQCHLFSIVRYVGKLEGKRAASVKLRQFMSNNKYGGFSPVEECGMLQ